MNASVSYGYLFYVLFNNTLNSFLINCYIGVGKILIGKNPKWLPDWDRSQIKYPQTPPKYYSTTGVTKAVVCVILSVGWCM